MDSRPCAACQSTKPATSSAQELQQQQRQQSKAVTTAVVVLVASGRTRSAKVLQILELVLMVGKWSAQVLQIHARSYRATQGQELVGRGHTRSQQVTQGQAGQTLQTLQTLYARTAHGSSKGAGIPLARSTEPYSVPTTHGSSTAPPIFSIEQHPPSP
jgi:hypothetical protein